jgi:biopolymer transport protein ExbD
MMKLALSTRRARPLRLTPMIDVIFLLVVFFLLAARFGTEAVLDLSPAGGAVPTTPALPRLLEIGPDGLWLNGIALGDGTLADGSLAARLTGPEGEQAAEVVVLRPVAGADVQRLVAVAAALTEAGLSRLVVVE